MKSPPLAFFAFGVVLVVAAWPLPANSSSSIHAILGGERTVVPFQYAWKFHYGDDPTSLPDSGPGSCLVAFEEDLQDYGICQGMERNPNRFSEKDCRTACCYDPNCYAWQAYPLKLGRQCFHAYRGMNNITCTKPEKATGIGGGRREKAPVPAFRTDYSFAVADATSDIDSDWPLVDAPHDFIAEYGNFTNDVTNFKQGYLPRNASWYRKHFTLPANWKSDGGSTHIHFSGVFHHATIFLNGEYLMQHDSGYTGFTVRIDNATHVRFGGQENVIALRADASFGSGHWYEGGGLYRLVSLVHVPATHIVHDGLFVSPQVDEMKGGLYTISASAEIESFGAASAALARFTLFSLDSGSVLATSTTAAVELNSSSAAQVLKTRMNAPVTLWSNQNPTRYRVRCDVLTKNGSAVDSVDVVVGFRNATFGASFALNGNSFKLRGFSHHNSMGGLGVAIPERVQLFRAQASLALGANTWRMSHNPYDPSLYTVLDSLGILVWDENRDYGAKYKNGVYAVAMRDMVKRDRNHACVIMYSFCNEYECQQNDPDYSAFRFRSMAKSVDPYRPVTGNDATFGSPSALDIQGCSHSPNKTFEKLHHEFPKQPLVLSECCSCTSQRPDRDLPSCISEQNSPGLLPFTLGSLGVWTLMDYFGEPAGTGTSGWPFVSSDFGNFDIAGFPKPRKYLLCLIDSFLAVMLIWVDLLPFVFESCGEYCVNGMEQTRTGIWPTGFNAMFRGDLLFPKKQSPGFFRCLPLTFR